MTNYPLANLKYLRDDMRKSKKIITASSFSYNKKCCDVLYTDMLGQTPQYQLLQLKFINTKNISDTLTCFANSKSLDVDTTEFFDFFGIKNNGGKTKANKIWNNIKKAFGSDIPTKVTNIYTQSQTNEMVRHIGQIDPEDDVNKVFCYKIMRLGKTTIGTQKYRTIYNSNKAQLLVPKVYNNFKKDKTLSFCFSSNPKNKKSEIGIITDFAKHNQN